MSVMRRELWWPPSFWRSGAHAGITATARARAITPTLPKSGCRLQGKQQSEIPDIRDTVHRVCHCKCRQVMDGCDGEVGWSEGSNLPFSVKLRSVFYDYMNKTPQAHCLSVITPSRGCAHGSPLLAFYRLRIVHCGERSLICGFTHYAW